eukprot:2532708-Prymnesium_polylepis.1
MRRAGRGRAGPSSRRLANAATEEGTLARRGPLKVRLCKSAPGAAGQYWRASCAARRCALSVHDFFQHRVGDEDTGLALEPRPPAKITILTAACSCVVTRSNRAVEYEAGVENVELS